MSDYFTVRCRTCRTERNQPLTVRESCFDCATDQLAKHRDHDVTLSVPGPVERTATTARLLGGQNRGW